ncbi:hypothetical protein [Streptomyces sp. NPDC058861]|uniref:hypothetical protein n=1 Tax=Streptomyces sp. NPDC058861 TaxID=3346653 RepID=UPI0036C1AA33
MSDEMMRPAGGEELPAVDEVLAAALTAQGKAGVRALDLLRDAHQVLADGLLRRSAEVAESCLRGAAEGLLSLPGSREAKGLTAAARDLLDAVDAHLDSGPGPSVAPDGGSAGAPGRPAPADEDAVDRAPAAEEQLGLYRASKMLRAQLARPGGYQRAQAAGIAERRMGVPLGAFHEPALNVWSDLYSKTSQTLHGRGDGDPARAAALYRKLLTAARELLVPLPHRAARIRELAALKKPGEAEARELAGWADPRATRWFFASGPAAAWLNALHEHAPHLLLADEPAGTWPAAPFLEHLAAASPAIVRPWLTAHAARLAAAGPLVLGTLLRLADAGALTPAGVRQLLSQITTGLPAGTPAEEAGLPRRLVASWAANLPVAMRDGDWLLVVENLLKDTVDLGHAGYQAYTAARCRAHAGHGPPPELTEVLQQQWAARLPAHDITGLLRELVVTVHTAGDGPFRWARPARNALAGLLRRDITAPVSMPWAAHVDLDEVRVLDQTVFLGPVLDMGPLLARAVLDLAAADAAVGLPLAERLRSWTQIATANEHVYDRVLAAHLTAHPPTAGSDATDAEAGEWWDRAIEATVRLLAGRPTPEAARLAALVLDACPPDRAAALHPRARAALGPAPTAAELDQTLPADGTPQTDGRLDPPAAHWPRVWAWSPVLPAPLLTDFAPLLAALHQLEPAGPPDPRTAARPRSRHHTALTLEDLLELAATGGPLAAATALTRAPDAGAAGYALVLRRLVGADPAAWTADVPRVLAALARPELAASYLAATAAAVRHPGAFPTGVAQTVRAALTLSRTLPAPADLHVPDAAELAGRAWSGLLRFAWRTGEGLGDDLPAVLDRLHTLAEPLTRPAALSPPAPGAGPGGDKTDRGDEEDAGGKELPAGLRETHPAVRALDCLLDHATGRATTDGAMPGDALRLVADVLAARSGDEAVAAAIGAHLPVLHRRATAFTAAHPELYALHPGRPSPAAAWLEHGGCTDPLLLAALDRGQLLDTIRANAYGTATRVAFALLRQEPPDLLGDPVQTWRELADGPDGAAAVSRLLLPLALSIHGHPRTDDEAENTAARAFEDIAHTWWAAALQAGLPPGTLAAAGHFASSALPDDMWLPLARRSAENTPAQHYADKAAERAAAHPRSPDALILAARLLTRPADPAYGTGVRRHARALLQAAEALPETERPAQTEDLRRALVEAGEVDLARVTAVTG